MSIAPADPALPPRDLPMPVGLAEVHAWLSGTDDGVVQWLGPAASPTGLAVWFRTHIQTVEVRRAHGLDWLVLQTTFCAKPRLRMAVLPVIAHANMQMESGRWFRLAQPTRMVCADEQPACGLDRASFLDWWQRFHRDAVSHGIELELRCRATNWLALLGSKGRKAPRPRSNKPRRQREQP
jgi:hypothetical protein